MIPVGAPARAAAALALEWRVERRHGVPAAALALALLWSAVLAAVPAPWAPTVAVYLLVVDTAGFGVLFAVVLVLYERGQGVRAALAVAPLRPAEYVGAKLAVLTVLAVALAAPLTLVAARGRPALGVAGLPPVLLGVALLSLLLVGLALAACGGGGGLRVLFTRLPLVAPLVLAPVAHISGALDTPLLYLVPTTGAAEWTRAGLLPQDAPGPWVLAAAAVYLLAWTAAAAALACRAVGPDVAERPPDQVCALGPEPGGRPLADAAGPGAVAAGAGVAAVGTGAERAAGTARRRGSGAAAWRRGGPWLGPARIDLRGTWRDPMLAAMLLGPVVPALGLRWGYPPVRGFLADRYGFDLDPVGPVLLAALVVLHVPLMIGAIGALRTLDDADDGTLAVLRVSPLGLNRYLAYRSAAAAAVSAAGLAAAVPLSGLAAYVSAEDLPALAAALVLAALQAPLLVLGAAAFAASRVEALVLVKTAGAVFTLLPVAVWWLPAWSQWIFAPVPLFWPVAVLPGYSAAPWPVGLAAGAAPAALAGAALLRRTRARLERSG
ncbi:fluoroquinolone export ABC transporter permease subunit [Streptomonospora litoralis]|uniref:Fluoroquinolones export permease protein n=1 Tax=Streptomonospora litoralis TaxID=2498135 RepID=A0A4V0ZJZ1_9ACTN|nr:hypothetical protein [Streptomonospora litoralis]QBI55162.1 Fluoroquinolones export permease protein [Streptomonospora litoralis]